MHDHRARMMIDDLTLAADPGLLAIHLVTLAGDRPILVALDHDGTLSPIAARPDDARLAPGAHEALADLAQLTDVVVVSGRALDDLIGRLGHLGLTIVSEHGLRLRTPDGRVEQLAPGIAPETLAWLRVHLAELLPDERLADGWIIEDKGVGLAVHHRLVPDDRLQPTLEEVRAALDMAAVRPGAGQGPGSPGGCVQTGKAVLELRAAGAEKGRALERLLADRPDALAVMLGDDATDEPALATARSTGGVGILVADGPRPSAASARITDPDAVVALLLALATELRARVSQG